MKAQPASADVFVGKGAGGFPRRDWGNTTFGVPSWNDARHLYCFWSLGALNSGAMRDSINAPGELHLPAMKRGGSVDALAANLTGDASLGLPLGIGLLSQGSANSFSGISVVTMAIALGVVLRNSRQARVTIREQESLLWETGQYNEK